MYLLLTLFSLVHQRAFAYHVLAVSKKLNIWRTTYDKGKKDSFRINVEPSLKSEMLSCSSSFIYLLQIDQKWQNNLRKFRKVTFLPFSFFKKTGQTSQKLLFLIYLYFLVYDEHLRWIIDLKQFYIPQKAVSKYIEVRINPLFNTIG